MTKPKHKNLSLLLISTVTFVFSLWVFVYFLSSNAATPKEVQASSYSADQVISSVNTQRKKSGLKELVKNDELMKSSQAKADHLAVNKYFSHVYKENGKRWSDFIKEADYNYSVAGENLANGFYVTNDMVDAWMESPTHRENILNEGVEETGVGVSYGELNGSPTIFVVQHFGKE
jgi:uncharacterized protein YkwD